MAANIEQHDVAILGAGPAGMSAALWCHELGLDAVLVEQKMQAGGQLLWTHNAIKNYPGIETQNGREMRGRFAAQLEDRGIAVVTADCVEADLMSRLLTFSDGQQLSPGSIVIATGVRRRRLNIPGETEFAGRGVLDSGANAGGKVRGKHVVIVGGGDAALENAVVLSRSAKHVTVVHRGSEFRAREEFVNAAVSSENMEVMFDSTLRSVGGGDTVEKVEIDRNGLLQTLAAEAVLIRIGVEPNSELFQDQLSTGPEGYIVIDPRCSTSIEGVFAIGDVANPDAPTIAAAVGMGATAARSCYQFLHRFPK